METTDINALTRSGYFGSRLSPSGPGRRADQGARLPVVHPPQAPVEYVVQGELLEKRRTTPSNGDYADLLVSLRNRGQVGPQDNSSTAPTRARATRRAISAYTEQALANTLAGATSTAIDYYI